MKWLVRRWSIVVLPLVVVALEGCSLLPAHIPRPIYHDFGPPAASRTRSTAVALDGVTAPAWLETGEIFYRPAGDPTSIRAYATQRWIAPPAELLAEYIRRHLLASNGQGTRLDVRLDRFEQDFARDGSAQAVLDMRVTIFTRSGRPLASHELSLSMPTSPDVAGAVQGLAALARRASVEIISWATAAGQKAKS